MVFLKVVVVGMASPRGLTVQCFPQEYFSPNPPFHFRCVGPKNVCTLGCELMRGWGGLKRGAPSLPTPRTSAQADGAQPRGPQGL